MQALTVRVQEHAKYSASEKAEYLENIRSVQEYVEKEVESDEADNMSEDSYSYAMKKVKDSSIEILKALEMNVRRRTRSKRIWV